MAIALKLFSVIHEWKGEIQPWCGMLNLPPLGFHPLSLRSGATEEWGTRPFTWPNLISTVSGSLTTEWVERQQNEAQSISKRNAPQGKGGILTQKVWQGWNSKVENPTFKGESCTEWKRKLLQQIYTLTVLSALRCDVTKCNLIKRDLPWSRLALPHPRPIRTFQNEIGNFSITHLLRLLIMRATRESNIL